MARHGTRMDAEPAPSNQNTVGRIVHIELDERTVLRRSPEVEQERAIAIFDLIEENAFTPVGSEGGTFHLHLSIENGRLIFDVRDTAEQPVDEISLSLMPFRQVVRDYFLICESYFDAIRHLTPSQIETIDMARRGLHDEGARFLLDRLEERVQLDSQTARRLFTLICVLHMRG